MWRVTTPKSLKYCLEFSAALVPPRILLAGLEPARDLLLRQLLRPRAVVDLVRGPDGHGDAGRFAGGTAGDGVPVDAFAHGVLLSAVRGPKSRSEPPPSPRGRLAAHLEA